MAYRAVSSKRRERVGREVQEVHLREVYVSSICFLKLLLMLSKDRTALVLFKIIIITLLCPELCSLCVHLFYKEGFSSGEQSDLFFAA